MTARIGQWPRRPQAIESAPAPKAANPAPSCLTPEPEMFDKLVIALISPLGTALTLGVFALVLSAMRWRRAGWVTATSAVLWLATWSLPVVSHGLRGALEAGFPPLAPGALPNAEAIVVLGGGIRPPGVTGDVPDLSGAADRVWFAARLFHAGKAPVMVLSGGSNPKVSATSEAHAMRGFAVDLGIPVGAMLLEEQSRNTRENARFTAELLRPPAHILLVTSALHMHRAKALFESRGFTVTPAPTDHEARIRFSAVDWLPDTEALDGSARAIKELVGRRVGR